MTMNFNGDWSGYGEGVTVSGIHVRIKESDEGLKIYALAKTLDAENEVIEFDGRLESKIKANLELLSYVSDNPENIPPRNVHVTLEAKPDTEQLEGKFATDIGTHGTVRLRKARRWGRFLLSIPFVFHRAYRHLKRFTHKRFRYGYFSLVITLSVLSVLGMIPSKMSAVEAIVLLVPLLFMFSDSIRQIITAMAVRKFGPVEFQEQAKPSPELNLPQLVTALHGEFGDKVTLFSALTEFLVPKTKSLLRLIISLNRNISMSEFNALAKKLGVPDENLTPTLQALVSGECISVNELGEVVVKDAGKQFLDFEVRLSQIYAR